jgi:hypothetical protein
MSIAAGCHVNPGTQARSTGLCIRLANIAAIEWLGWNMQIGRCPRCSGGETFTSVAVVSGGLRARVHRVSACEYCNRFVVAAYRQAERKSATKDSITFSSNGSFTAICL